MSTQDNTKNGFFYPLSSYRGEFSPGTLTFNANLQEFAHKVSFICNLETGGKISPQEAYEQINELWHKLQFSKEKLLDRLEL